jgi:RimJ/RimL family protein N-acetyltransferase
VLAPADPWLSDGVVSLRPHTAADASWIAEACADAETQRWLPLPSPYTEADALAYIRRNDRVWSAGTHAPHAIVDAVSGEPLGSAELTFHEPEVGEIGYWVRPQARGRGAATRATRLLAAWAFELGVVRLQLSTHPANVVSQRVAERVGFRREGILRAAHRTPEGLRDSLMFSLLRGEL